MIFHALLVIGGGIIGTHVVILIRKLCNTLDSVNHLVADTQYILDHNVNKLVTRCNEIAEDADFFIAQTSPILLETTKNTDMLIRKLQTAVDNWNDLCEVVELVPIRRKVKQIICLPFTCCRADAPKV